MKIRQSLFSVLLIPPLLINCGSSGSGGQNADALPAEGLSLFNKKCARCHTDISEFEKLEADPDEISEALQENEDHDSIDITDDELDVLVELLAAAQSADAKAEIANNDDKKKGKDKGKDKDKKKKKKGKGKD